MLSKTVKLSLLLSVMLLLTAADAEARKWTLAECIDYALKNNITLQKLLIAKQSATEDVLFSKAALQPTLTAQTRCAALCDKRTKCHSQRICGE